MSENANSSTPRQIRGPGGPGMRGMRGEKGKDPAAALGKVLRYVLKDYKLACVLVVVGIAVSAVTTLMMTLFMRTLIDDYIMPMIGAATPDFGPLARRLMQLVAILIVGIACSYAQSRIMVNVGQGTMKRLRLELFRNMESLPIKYFDTHAHGDIMSVYTNDVDTLRQMIGQSLPQLVNSLLTLIPTFISMIVLDVPLTLISVAMVGVMLFVTSRLSRMAGKFFVSQQRDLGRVNGFIEEMLEGQKVVKVFCHEEQSKAQFEELNDALRESARNANTIASITMPINGNLGNLSYVLCAVAGAALALNGFTGLTIGTLVAFLSLNKGFTMPVTQLSQQIASIVMASAGAERVFSLMDEEPEKDEGYVELVRVREEADGSLTECEEQTGIWAWKDPEGEAAEEAGPVLRRLRGKVTFEDVDFGYTDDKTVLHDINMYALPGEKVALVGSTGAGKTTIMNLVNRFYDIQDGRICFDDIDVKRIRKADLRRSLGIVLQDTHLFTGMVMENIRYGRLDATDEDCVRAARLANADGFIRRLPDGYETMLTGDGGNLSQGQRQLLAIARAAVADPPALILDEATSSIDTRTEMLVQRGMDSLMAGRTSFVIAHRLSTIKNADCIMVMEAGRIIERGSHERLLEKKGRYYRLYTGKSE
ncbi:MAG: ABC transporter ATP-binding protein [Eubacterium sp.]|nr:ABC transporter ATP-binding protein [Eubacterium sp.]